MVENLILFWGWGEGDQSYQGLIDAAPENWNVYPLNFQDLVNHNWIDRCQRFLDNKGLDKVSLAGHSLGGAFAIQFAHACPEKVKHLYLLDSAGIFENRSFWQIVVNLCYPSPDSTKGGLLDFGRLKLLFRHPILNIRLAWYALWLDLEKQMRELRVPTTIIWAEKDKLTPLRQGRRLQQIIPKSKLVVLPGKGHNWPLTTPMLFWKNIRRFVS